MLLPRVLTAFVGIPLLLFLIHWGGLSFALLTGAVAVLCLYEYGVILLLGGRPISRMLAALGGTALALCAALGGPLGLVLAGVIGAVVLRELFAAEHSLDRMSLTLFGALFLGWMPAHLALIRDLRPFGEKPGSNSLPGPLVRRCSCDPFASMMKTSKFPPRSLEKTIDRMSGDHSGY